MKLKKLKLFSWKNLKNEFMYYVLTNCLVTAYCACKICCGQHSHGIDASGHKPIENETCALPRQFPIGSKVIIDGKTYIGTDRYSKKLGTRIDLFFPKHKIALAFGKQSKRVVIITNK